jgi:hypothetical protein
VSTETVFLVEPAFPLPAKSRNHYKWLPLPLLKIATYMHGLGHRVVLIRGCNAFTGLRPNRILVTSLFTYWSSYVAETVQFYKNLYPDVSLTLGGVYATLLSCGKPNDEKDCATCAKPCHPRRVGADEVWIGDWEEVDQCVPDYSLVGGVDFQMLQVSKGCPHGCEYCANHRLSRWRWHGQLPEPLWANKAVFLDSAFLNNPGIAEILEEIAAARPNGRVVKCEAQSGYDKRVLIKHPELAASLKKARFITPRIAWDGGMREFPMVREAIQILTRAGYAAKDIQVFVIYNWALPFEAVEEKRRRCFELGVQVADCRYRPLDALSDRYDPRARRQGPEDYFIHPAWSDEEVREFRRRCRRHNIEIRFGRSYEQYRAWRAAGGKPRGTGKSRRVYPMQRQITMKL